MIELRGLSPSFSSRARFDDDDDDEDDDEDDDARSFDAHRRPPTPRLALAAVTPSATVTDDSRTARARIHPASAAVARRRHAMSARGVAQCRPRIIHARVAMTDAVDADLERERAFDRALSAVPADVRARVVEATEEEREARERVEAAERHLRRMLSGSDSFAAFDELEAPRANLKTAERAVKRAGVYAYDLDARGVPVPSTRRRFSMLAGHRRVGASSVSLALYLDTVLQFGILTLLLASTSVYSLVKNVTDDAFTSMYEVRGWDASAGATTTTTCGRAYATDGVVLRTSQGSRCAIPPLQSFYNCPMVCEYGGANGTFDAVDTCTTHYPCTLKSLLDDAADALCCEPRVANAKTQTPAEFQGVSIVVTILFLLFDILYSYNRHTAADIIQTSTVTAGDYSVLVDGLGKGNTWTRQQLAEFFSHYGEVVSVCHLTNTHKHVKYERQIQQAVKQKCEIEVMLADAEGDVPEEKLDFLTRLRQKLFRFVVLRGMEPTLENKEKLEKKIEHLREKVKTLGTSGSDHLGSAVVTFNYEQHAMNCMDDHCNSWIQRQLARFTGKTPPDFYGRELIVARAPETSDINWKNLRLRESNVQNARISILSKLVIAIALVIGGLIQYFFEYIRSEEFKKINDQVALASTPSTSAYIKLQIIASITSLIVVIINFSLDTLTTMLSRLSAYKTQTAHKNVLIASLTFVNLLNYVVVPIITNRCSSVADGVCNWYVPGGFIEYAFYLQLFRVISIPGRGLDAVHLFTRKVLAPMAKTLQVQEDLLAPPEFALARSYAELLSILGMAAIYAPALPSSYFIALFGIFLLYWTKKYQGLFTTSAPPKLKEDAFGITTTLRVISLLQILFGCLVFYRFDSEINTTLWINLAIWIVSPLTRIYRVLREREPHTKSTGGVSFEKNAGLHDSTGEWRSMRSDETIREIIASTSSERASLSETRANLIRRAFLCRMYKCDHEELLGKGRLALYHPLIPAHAGAEQLELLLKNYEPFPVPVPAKPDYLPGQSHRTGGENTAVPSSRERAKLDILASLERRKREALGEDNV